MNLVTGATGLIGAHVLFKLSKKCSSSLIGLYRDHRKIEPVKDFFACCDEDHPTLFNKIEWRKADLLHQNKVEESIEGVTKIFHCAGRVSYQGKGLHLDNVVATRNLVNSALTNKTEKLVFVSSIAALGVSDSNNIVKESTPRTDLKHQSAYAVSKYNAELEVWRARQEGLDICILYPGVVLSNYFREHSSGRIISRFSAFPKFYINGNISFVSAWDVAEASELCMDSKTKNQQFILVAGNMSIRKLVDKVNQSLGNKPSSIRIGRGLWTFIKVVDWFKTKLLFKKSELLGIDYRTISNSTQYDGRLITEILPFIYTEIYKIIRN